MDGSLIVEKLLAYARNNLYLNPLDEIYYRNFLFKKLNISRPFDGKFDLKKYEKILLPDEILDELREYLKKSQLIEERKIEHFLVEIMGMLSELPSRVVEKFWLLQNKDNEAGLNYLYDLEVANNYIQKTAVSKNLHWISKDEKNFLEITINLSKPEKNNKDIAKLKFTKDVKYPKCLLCIENLGYQGRNDHPARENLRIIPMRLNGEEWFLQYSPYVYYDHHCIAVKNSHEPMKINRDIFNALVDFIDLFPTFFIGSNTELPIVGGSILNHEHFQGGRHKMPLMFAKARYVLEVKKFFDVKVSYLDWYNSCFEIRSKNRVQLLDCVNYIFNKWREYDDEQISIIHRSDEQHSTITPIVRKIDDEYIFYIILRNNRTDEDHPDGIFHAHKEYHNIKSEGIGLIEAMGLFILPARLKRQMKEIENLLVKNDDLKNYYQEHPDMVIHSFMIDDLIRKNPCVKHESVARGIVTNHINDICRAILENTAVFKNDEEGQAHLKMFIKHLML